MMVTVPVLTLASLENEILQEIILIVVASPLEAKGSRANVTSSGIFE